MNLNQWKKIKKSGTFTRKRHAFYSEMNQVPIFKNVGILNHDKSIENSEMVVTNGFAMSPADLLEYEENTESINENFSRTYISEDDSDKEEYSKRELIVQKIKEWSTKYNIRHSALKELMGIMNFMEPGLLPADPRTLLETPIAIVLKNIGKTLKLIDDKHNLFDNCSGKVRNMQTFQRKMNKQIFH